MADNTLSSPLLASFKANYRDLLKYLAHRTGNVDDARDLAQDAWLRAADMASSGRGPALHTEGEARAYLFTIARNLVIDHHRRAAVAQRHADGFASLGDLTRTPDVAESAMYSQAIAAVEAALASLPERAREVFVRHRVRGEDQVALSQTLGISRNTVERDMMLAMDRVEAALARWHSGSAKAGQLRNQGRRRSLAALLSVAGVCSAGLSAFASWRWWRVSVPHWQQALATGRGKGMRQTLPDESTLALDAMTQVQIAYYGARRHVRLLSGAAFFDVVRDEARPFVVEAPLRGDSESDVSVSGLRVTVLGTRFSVERWPDNSMDVQVEEGRVRVESIGAAGQTLLSQELRAGQAWRGAANTANGPTGSTQIQVADSQSVASWRHGILTFDDAALGDMIDRLKRYMPRPVDITPAAASLRLSGQIRIGQVEDFLRTLPGILPVRSTLSSGRWSIDKRS